jgi:hypothetical protein
MFYSVASIVTMFAPTIITYWFYLSFQYYVFVLIVCLITCCFDVFLPTPNARVSLLQLCPQ